MHRNSGPHGPNLKDRAALDRAHHRLWAVDENAFLAGARWAARASLRPLVQCWECRRCRVCGCFCWPVGWRLGEAL